MVLRILPLRQRQPQQHNNNIKTINSNNNNIVLPRQRNIRILSKYATIAILSIGFIYTFVAIGIYLGEAISDYYTSIQQQSIPEAPHSVQKIWLPSKDTVYSIENTITIYLYDGFESLVNPAYPHRPATSIFITDFLQRYGSGHFRFVVKDLKYEYDHHEKEECVEKKNLYPCLVVYPYNINATALIRTNCQLASCKTMVIGDEFCNYRHESVREYYSSDLQKKGYLPLGMRSDTWSSFQQLMKNRSTFSIPLSSKRKYEFNAIFSESTSVERKHLAIILENQTQAHNAFVSIAKKWYKHVNSPRADQIGTDQYVNVLLDSAFALAPAGHNPECFRLYEAVESGSIPIVVLSDQHPLNSNDTHPCKDSLHHWRDSPIVFLQSWDDLYPTLKDMLNNASALDQRQAELQSWYKRKMSMIVSEFESFMINRDF